MILTSSASGRPVLTSTSRPAFFKMLRPWSVSLSLTKILGIGLLIARANLLPKHLQRRGDAGPWFHFETKIGQTPFDRAQHGHHVEFIEVAQVRDAEDLPLRRVLAAGNGHVEVLLQVFVNFF